MLGARRTEESARLRDRLRAALCPNLLSPALHRSLDERPERLRERLAGSGARKIPSAHGSVVSRSMQSAGSNPRFRSCAYPAGLARSLVLPSHSSTGSCMWPWTQSAGWYRSISRSRSEANAGFNGSPWNPPPNRARARRVVGYHHHSFTDKLRPCELFLDEVPGGPMPSDRLPRAEVPPPVSNRAREIRYAPAQPSVRPDLVGLAVELQVRPQGRPDEAGALDPDRTGVEEVDPDFRTLLGESRPRVVDLHAVELVVPEDVDDVRGGRPELRELRHESPSCRGARSPARTMTSASGWCAGTAPPCSRWRSERTWIFIVRSVDGGPFTRTQLSCPGSCRADRRRAGDGRGRVCAVVHRHG